MKVRLRFVEIVHPFESRSRMLMQTSHKPLKSLLVICIARKFEKYAG
jgi:hypothetical protein